MTRKQEMCISEAVKNLQTARKWLDQAMYYSDEQMQGRDLKKTREAYDLVCSVIDKIG